MDQVVLVVPAEKDLEAQEDLAARVLVVPADQVNLPLDLLALPPPTPRVSLDHGRERDIPASGLRL